MPAPDQLLDELRRAHAAFNYGPLTPTQLQEAIEVLLRHAIQEREPPCDSSGGRLAELPAPRSLINDDDLGMAFSTGRGFS
jgi:hypothetical protein